ncbi:MAG TPA: hypothetical protein VK458_08480, partial [Myxococcaceae bacterium]|nr:hypothetical protein [Myxococcaceae bacterium]
PGREPLGARLSLDGERWFTVVGVVGDVRNEALAKEPYPQLYLPFAQMPMRSMYLAVRAAGEPRALVGTLRREVAALDSELPLADIRTMDERLSRSVEQPRVNVLLLGGFAGGHRAGAGGRGARLARARQSPLWRERDGSAVFRHRAFIPGRRGLPRRLAAGAAGDTRGSHRSAPPGVTHLVRIRENS